jgi:xanthine dehydrogenase accessory factor
MEEFYSFVGKRLAEGKKVVVASVIESDGSVPQGSGAAMAISEDGPTCGTVGGGCVERYIVKSARTVFKDGKTKVEEFNLGDDSWSGIGMSCGGKLKMLMQLVEPRERLIIFGSGGIAKSCAQIAKMLAYDVIVLDPFADEESFPGCEIYTQGVLHKIKEIPITPFDSILMLTDHRYDFEALQTVLNTKDRVNQTFKQLLEQGAPLDKLLTVFAPVGIDIGAVTPQEISVSIMAEVIHARKGGSLKHLRLTGVLERPEKTHISTEEASDGMQAGAESMPAPLKTR